MKLGKREVPVRQYLSRFGFKGQDQQKKANELSGGERNRCNLAKLLKEGGNVLLLDEPASGLDPRARIEFREILRELQRMGKTIFVSSHILADLAQVCDSVAIIEAGKLVVAGKVREIRSGIPPSPSGIVM